MMSKADKEHISRGINRTVRNVHRSWIPEPRRTIEEPAAIVIRRPSPRLIRNPCPAVVRLPYPVSNLIGRPGDRLVWLPHLSIPRDIDPVAVAVQVLNAGVVTIGPAPALCVVDDPVAVFVPTVPIVFGRRAVHPVFRTVG